MRLRRCLKVLNKNEIKLTKARRLELMFLPKQDPSNHEIKMYLANRRLEREQKQAEV